MKQSQNPKNPCLKLQVSPTDGGLRLDVFCATHIETQSRNQIQKLNEEGRILVDEVRRAHHYKVSEGESIQVELPPETARAAPAPEKIPIGVVFEDDDILVVNKPAGMVVHPAHGNQEGTLVNAVLGLGWIAAMAGLADGILVLLGRDPTLTGRTEIWREVIPVILERPLLGHSIVSYWQLDIVKNLQWWAATAHNGFLQILIDLGILGLALLVVQISSMFFHAVRWHGWQPGRGAIWPICMVSIFVLYNLVEVMLMTENSIIWVLVVATSLGVRRAAARRRCVE